MKKQLTDLSVFGGKPEFEENIPIGQLYFPSKEEFRIAFEDIFSRQYYTNHGALAQKFEADLEKRLKVKHAIAMTNGTLALIITAKALGLSGKVILPAYTFVATAQSLSWAGLEPVFCDVNPYTHLMTPDLVEPLISNEVCAILGVHLWGNPSNIDGLSKLAKKYNIKLYFDACHAFDNEYNGIKIGNFGDAEIFSFHATKVLGTAEGGLVCTNNDELAAKIRNIRSSYGSGFAIPIPLTGNGRFSEAQAALGILSLQKIDAIMDNNKKYVKQYTKCLDNVQGITIMQPSCGNNNCQYVIAEIDSEKFGISRDQLINVLKKENINARRYFYPGINKLEFYANKYPEYINTLPITEQLCESVIQLPSGQAMTIKKISQVCDLIKYIQQNSPLIQDKGII